MASGHRLEIWQRSHTLQPCQNRRIVCQFKAALVSYVGVGIKRDVCRGRMLPCEIRRFLKLLLHHSQRFVAAGLLRRIFLSSVIRQPKVLIDEAGYRDIGLMAILFEKLPLQDTRLSQPTLGV